MTGNSIIVHSTISLRTLVINANNLEVPSIARLADDRAAQQDPHDVDGKLIEWLKHDQARGEFAAVHIAPDGAALVVLFPLLGCEGSGLTDLVGVHSSSP